MMRRKGFSERDIGTITRTTPQKLLARILCCSTVSVMQSLNHRNRDTHRVTHNEHLRFDHQGRNWSPPPPTRSAPTSAFCDGTIVALGGELSGAMKVIDASGRLVLPGGIDSHVHIAQPSGPGIVMADDFDSGTRVGGVRRQHHGAAVLPCSRRARACARW